MKEYVKIFKVTMLCKQIRCDQFADFVSLGILEIIDAMKGYVKIFKVTMLCKQIRCDQFSEEH